MSKKDRLPRKLKKQIPKGVYCYTPLIEDGHKFGDSYRIKPCSFYTHITPKEKPEELQDEIDKKYPDETIGWCKWLKYEIDDQCKSCGINKPYK